MDRFKSSLEAKIKEIGLLFEWHGSLVAIDAPDMANAEKIRRYLYSEEKVNHLVMEEGKCPTRAD